MPYSFFVDFGQRRANYVRNSVKVVIDAYTGQMTAYAVRPDDPILRAYEASHDYADCPRRLGPSSVPQRHG